MHTMPYKPQTIRAVKEKTRAFVDQQVFKRFKTDLEHSVSPVSSFSLALGVLVDWILEGVYEAWEYDPQLRLRVKSRERLVFKTERLYVAERDRGVNIFYCETKRTTTWGDVVDDIISRYVDSCAEVLRSVTDYVENKREGVCVGDEVIALNGTTLVDLVELSYVAEGSDSYEVLEVDERWVRLEGLGCVGWDKVLEKL
jgi:hypothetical protein